MTLFSSFSQWNFSLQRFILGNAFNLTFVYVLEFDCDYVYSGIGKLFKLNLIINEFIIYIYIIISMFISSILCKKRPLTLNFRNLLKLSFKTVSLRLQQQTIF